MDAHLALVGGDEFRAGCAGMDRAVLKAIGKSRPRVLILPTAAAAYNPSKAASNGVAYFQHLGAEASSLMVLAKREADDDEFLAPVDSADLVYLSGGNPGHLLQTLAGSLLLERMKTARQRGAILAGSSAGAMVLGPWMRLRAWSEALGIVGGVAVLPHHERADPDDTARELTSSAPSGLTVLGIDAMTCCFGGAEGWTVLGSGGVTLYEGGRWTRHHANETITIPGPKEESTQ